MRLHLASHVKPLKNTSKRKDLQDLTSQVQTEPGDLSQSEKSLGLVEEAVHSRTRPLTLKPKHGLTCSR